MQSIGHALIRRRAVLLVVVLGVAVAGIVGAVKKTTDHLLYQSATEAALDSASLFAEGASDFEQMLAGAPPSPSTAAFLARARQADRVYGLFDRDGHARLPADGGAAPSDPAAVDADAVRALTTNAPVLAVREGRQADRPAFFGEAFLPLLVGGRAVAVVSAAVDQTAEREQAGKTFLISALSLSLLAALAFLVPAAFWLRSTKERQVSDWRSAQFAKEANAQHQRLDAVLSNMPLGLCMFDADVRLVLCNARYAEMYRLPPELVRPGTTLQAIVDYRHSIGNGPKDFPNYATHHTPDNPEGSAITIPIPLEDGRTIRISRLTLSAGSYVATHEDMTEAEIEASRARTARELAEARAARVTELERKNEQLEAFSYSVSHDLRAPLRAIDGFSHAILEDCGDRLDTTGRNHIGRIRAAAQKMAGLIEDMLQLSRVTRAEMILGPVDLSSLAHEVVDGLRRQDADHDVEVVVGDGLVAAADERMMRIVLENLLGNAWKFTRRTERPIVEFGARSGSEPAYFIRDNGAGFDMAFADKLFHPFQRLHSEREFPGTGIGLATIHRVIDRHGGRVWAEGEVNRGAAFFFTLPGAGAAAGPS